MATQSSILARIIPWTEEPGWLQSIGSEEFDTTERARTHTRTHAHTHTHTHTHTFLTSSRKDVSAKRDHVFSMFSSAREEGDPTKKGSLHISCLPNISPDDPSYPSILCMQ